LAKASPASRVAIADTGCQLMSLIGRTERLSPRSRKQRKPRCEPVAQCLLRSKERMRADEEQQTDALSFSRHLPELGREFVDQLFFNSPIGIYIVQNGIFRFVNPEFQRITGYSEQELLNQESLSLVYPEDKQKVRRNAIRMLKGERPAPYQARIVDKNGEVKWILETISSISYRGERAALGYFMDNTEQELIKEALRLSDEKFQKAFRSSPDWVVISTLEEGIYLEVNQAFLHTTGYRREEVIGRSSTELGIWADPEERDALYGVLKEHGKICNAEVHFKTRTGKTLYVLWSAEVFDYEGEKCLIAVTRDITDRKLAEQEKMHREKLQGVLEMAGATCHEMNQPLQNIFFMLDELLEENPESDTAQNIYKQVERIKNITIKLENITIYETKDYIQGGKIIDIDKASNQCPIDPGSSGSFRE
jgi:PAS domain S-box-containing protein